MIATASASVSTEIRCSYQPIASASSVSEAHIRANVRVCADSSSGGSWYWSNPIFFLLDRDRQSDRVFLPRQQWKQRLQLDLGLRQLLRRIGVADDPIAGVAASDRAAQQRAAQGHAELAVAGAVGPAHGARVPAAIE